MMRYLFLLLFLISPVVSFSQTIEIGPSLQYHRTAFQKPDSGTIVISSSGGSSEGVKTTETDSNIAFGGYFGYYTENTFAYLAELFYVATSSPNYGDNSFQTINLIPSVAAELGNSNLFINVGVGAGFILNQPDFEGINDVVGEKFNSIDILAKMALNFRLKNLFTLDGGILMGATDIVDDQNRFHFYLGARVPMNLLIN